MLIIVSSVSKVPPTMTMIHVRASKAASVIHASTKSRTAHHLATHVPPFHPFPIFLNIPAQNAFLVIQLVIRQGNAFHVQIQTHMSAKTEIGIFLLHVEMDTIVRIRTPARNEIYHAKAVEI